MSITEIFGGNDQSIHCCHQISCSTVKNVCMILIMATALTVCKNCFSHRICCYIPCDALIMCVYHLPLCIEFRTGKTQLSHTLCGR